MKPEELFEEWAGSKKPRHLVKLVDHYKGYDFVAVEELYQHFKARLVREVFALVDGKCEPLIDMQSMVPPLEQHVDVARVIDRARAVVEQANLELGDIWLSDDVEPAVVRRLRELQAALKGL